MVNETVKQYGIPSTNFTKELDPNAFAGRLNQVREARHIRSTRAFAAFVGVSVTVMRGYLAGKNDPSRESLIRISRTCDVSIEWLATGHGQMQAAAPAQTDIAQPKGLFATVHVDNLAECLTAARDAFTKRGVIPEPRRVVQVALILYDALEAPDDDMAGLADKVVSNPGR